MMRVVKGLIFVNRELTTPENTITYHNALCLSPPNVCRRKEKNGFCPE